MGDGWEPSPTQRVFIAALAKMVSPMNAADATSAMMPMLGTSEIRGLPDWVFARPADLALDIGADMLNVPSLAKLRRALRTYHDTHKPKQAAVTQDLDMPAADRCMVGFWREYREGVKILPPGVTLESWLDTFRNSCPAAIRYICKTDPAAGEIAARREWYREQHRGERAPEDVERVHRLVQECQAAMQQRPLDSFRQRDTGEHALHQPSTIAPAAIATPPPPPPAMAEAFEAKYGRKPGALSAEHLAEARKNNPILQAVGERQEAEAVRARAANDLARVPDIPPESRSSPARPVMPWDEIC